MMMAAARNTSITVILLGGKMEAYMVVYALRDTWSDDSPTLYTTMKGAKRGIQEYIDENPDMYLDEDRFEIEELEVIE